MTTLNEADKLYFAGLPVTRVYLDSHIVWPPRAYGKRLYGRELYGSAVVPLLAEEPPDE
jgi:hypothetical protein